MLDIKSLFTSSKYRPLDKNLVKEYNRHRPAGPQKYLCYVPFKSIYFGHHGRAIACCYNRTHILGTYPQQSIKEIWFGEEAERLRDYMRNDDLSLGCHGCNQHIVSGNFDGIKSIEADEFPMNKNKYPSTMSFELSNVCNLECEMCSGDFSSLIRAKREKLPPVAMAYDSEFVKQLEEFIPYLEEVKFYGGEPFLIDIYHEIWDLIIKIKPSIRITLQTNGTVLNSRVKELLRNSNFHIGVSLDSLKKDVYESIRKNADFETVMKNVEYFHAYSKERDTFFGLSVCAMQQNWSELPDFVNYCNQLNVPVYFHTVSYPLHCSIRTMKPDELVKVSEYLWSFNFPEDNATQKKNKRHYFDFAKQVDAWAKISGKIAGREEPSTMAKLKVNVAEHIRSDKALNDTMKAARIEKIIGKITELDHRLDKEFVANAMAKIDINDPSLLDNVVFYVDKLPLAALVAMSKTTFK